MDPPQCFVSWDSFAECIVQMKALSDELLDGWEFHGDKNLEGGAYLTKKLFKAFEGVSVASLEVEGSEEEPGHDVSYTSEGRQLSSVTLEYHVVFNVNYSCPVLCFNGWKGSGSLLSLEECLQHLGFSSFDYKYSALTQMDHPVLMRPFITLHPCKTAELIGTFHGSKNPVVSWLSTVGPIVGLSILSEYATLTF